MEVGFATSFLRMLAKLPIGLQEEAMEKIERFRDEKSHKQLKVHALRGSLAGRYSFSVNFQTRIVFRYQPTKPKSALLLSIGDHDIYK